MIPISPDAATNAVEKFLSYPSLLIDGIMTSPIAATVAGPEPEIAEKKQQLMTATIAKPPWICPTNRLTKSMSLLVIPALSIANPARIKKGIASMVNFDVAEKRITGTIEKGTCANMMVNTPEIPSATDIGTFNKSRSMKIPKRDIDNGKTSMRLFFP